MALSQMSVKGFYKMVINETINNCREIFTDEGVDEQVLQELKHIWEQKVEQSPAVVEDIQTNENQNTNQTNNTSTNQTKSRRSTVLLDQNNVNNIGNQKFTNQSATTSNGSIINNSNTVNTMAPQVPQPPPAPVQPVVNHFDPNRLVPIQITVPPSPSTNNQSRKYTIHVPTNTILENKLGQILTGPVLQKTFDYSLEHGNSLLQSHVDCLLRGMPSPFNSIDQLDGASSTYVKNKTTLFKMRNENNQFYIDAFLDGKQTTNQSKKLKKIVQVDGLNNDNNSSNEDMSTSDDDDDDDDDKDDKDEENDIDDDDDDEGGGEDEPLNSEDDVSEDDTTGEIFDTDNVIVCQYDKINRSRNKWKFYLKDGIMNIDGVDYIFQRLTGEAEW